MVSAEEQARRLRFLARLASQRALDAMVAGNPLARAALARRYEPIAQYQKEGPHVGEREEPHSQAGRVN